MADTANITSASPEYVSGTFFVGPTGSTLPTDAVGAVDSAFSDLGYVGEDGYVYAFTRDTDEVKAFGGDTVYTLQTNYDEELTLTLIESKNADVLKLVYGDDNVTVNGDKISVNRNKKRAPRKSFVIDLVTDDGLRRLVVPVGQVTNVGDVPYSHGDIIKYELTIKAYPDDQGNCSYEYLDADGS